ncbi:MAG: glycosyltransferase family protein [Alphaproteobacteria bacterium]
MPGNLLLYAQHLLGIGHLVRAAGISRALAERGFAVTFVSGGVPVPGLETGAARFVQLPPVRAGDESFTSLIDQRGRRIDDAWRRRRRQRLLDIYRGVAPDILVLETYPFGRRQMAFELDPLLDAARGDKAPPIIATSIRDVVIPSSRPERVEQAIAKARRYLDLVLVHGDPRLIRLTESFPRAAALGDLLRYTGYVVTPATAPPGEEGREEILVSAGGGAVGARLLSLAIAARPRTDACDAPWRVLVGHNLPDDRFRAMRREAPPGVTVARARRDFQAMLARCRLSISQGGYNTILEALAAGARTVCVPFAGAGEIEQTLRCRRLAERGLVEVVEEDAATPESLAAAVNRALSAPSATCAIDMEGAWRTASLLAECPRP